MNIHRHLYGNLPNKGFTTFTTDGFAVKHPLVDKGYLRLPDESPIESGLTYPDGQRLRLSTFEVQPLAYGRYALIRSVSFLVTSNSRPFQYTDIVIPGGDGKTDLGTLLTFDVSQFTSHTDWLACTRRVGTVLDDQAWTPQEAPIRRAPAVPYRPGDPDTELRLALLARFWASCSSAIFKGEPLPFTVCIRDSLNPEEVNAEARRLLREEVLPYLPVGVANIVSMTSGVPAGSVQTCFSDTAMAVVLKPTGRSLQPAYAPDFDLRKGRRSFAPDLVSDVEREMMAWLLQGEGIRARDEAFARWQALTGCTDERDCTMMADYDVFMMTFMLEATLTGIGFSGFSLPDAQLPDAWAMLCELLSGCSHVSADQVSFVLQDMEGRLIDRLLAAPAALSALSDKTTAFLWEKALSVNPTHFPAMLKLLASCPLADRLPALLTSSLAHTADPDRLAQMVREVLSTAWAGQPVSAAHAAALAAPELAYALMRPENQPVLDAMRALIVKHAAAFPDQLLSALPMAALLPDPCAMLADAVALLERSYTAELPTAQEQQTLGDLLRRFATDNTPLLDELDRWFCACMLDTGRAPLSTLADALTRVLPLRRSHTLAALLSTAADIRFPLTPTQIIDLAELTTDFAAEPAGVAEALLREEAAYAAHRKCDRSERLARLSVLEDLLTWSRADISAVVSDVLDDCIRTARMLSAEDSDRLTTLWQRHCPEGESREFTRALFQVYLDTVTSGLDDPLHYLKNPGELASLQPVMSATGVNMHQSAITLLGLAADSGYAASAPQLTAFLRAIVPLCDRTRMDGVWAALIDYASRFGMLPDADGLPLHAWLWQLSDLHLEDKALDATLDRPRERLHAMALDAVLHHCSAHLPASVPDEEALDRLVTLAESGDAELARRASDLSAMYASAMNAGCPAAKDQLLRLADTPMVLDGTLPAVHDALCVWARDRFLSHLSDTGDYWAGATLSRADLACRGVTEDELLDAPTRECVGGMLLNYFADVLPVPELLTTEDGALAGLWNRSLGRAFVQQYPTAVVRCANRHELDALERQAKALSVSADCAATDASRLSTLAKERAAAFSGILSCSFDEAAALVRRFHSLLTQRPDAAGFLCRVVSAAVPTPADLFRQYDYLQISCALVRNTQAGPAVSIQWKSVFEDLDLLRSGNPGFDTPEGRALRAGIYAIANYAVAAGLAHLRGALCDYLTTELPAFARAMCRTESARRYAGPRLFDPVR